jgi:exopolysaccharide biosynthesis polyprenyl glycosylphosphotransferase
MSSIERVHEHGESVAQGAVGRPTLAPAPVAGESAVLLPQRRPGADRFWRDQRRRRMLAMADLGAGMVASLLLVGSAPRAIWALALLPGWVLIAKLFGLYDRDQRSIRHLTVDELSVIAAWAAACVAALGLLLPLTPAGEVGFQAVVGAWVAATLAAVLLRGAMRWLWRRTTPPEYTAVIGDGELAMAARRKLELFPDMHLALVEGRSLSLGADNGSPRELAVSMRELVAGLDRVLVAWERMDPEFIGELAGICREEQVKLSVVSPLRGRAGASPRLSEVAELPVLEYDTRDFSRSTQLLKRCFDLFVSVGALAVLAPLFPFMALAIKLDSRGPVFFTQLRAGRRGVPFRVIKLRTMVANAEQALSDVVVLDELPEPMFKLQSDPRVTRVGRLLRRFSLDELPQLFNVLRGEMSIVGPRPEQVELVERYSPEHRFRLQVKPGMTGPMQVFGRGDLDFAERLAVEFDYVENVSLARDLRILFQTLPVVLRGDGAY